MAQSKCDPIAEWMEILHAAGDSIGAEKSHLAAAGIETEALPSPGRVQPVAFTEISISPIARDSAALHADDFPANTARLPKRHNGHA